MRLAVAADTRHRRLAVHAVDIGVIRQMRHFVRTQKELQVEQRVLADAHALVKPKPVKQLARVELVPDVVVNAVHVDDLPNDLCAVLRHRREMNRHALLLFHVKERMVGRDDLRPGRYCVTIERAQAVLLQRVVRIHERDIPARRQREAPIARSGHAAVFRMDHPRPGLDAREIIQHRARRVSRAVVDEEHLNFRLPLRLETLQTHAQIAFGVVAGHDDADIGL